MTRSRTACETHLQRAGIALGKRPEDLHNLCPCCLRARDLRLPAAYADLGGLARCSACGVIADCRDPVLLARVSQAGIDPAEAYLCFPRLRRPLNGPNIEVEAVDALICLTRGEGR